jgi:hypothetical protein
MVAGILEKSKRLRKAFFFIQKTPKERSRRLRNRTAECWGARWTRRNYTFEELNLEDRSKDNGAPAGTGFPVGAMGCALPF